MGTDQFFSDNKFDETSVTPRRRIPKASQISSMSSPQSTSVTRGPIDPGPTDGLQNAAKRRLKKIQQDPNNPYS